MERLGRRALRVIGGIEIAMTALAEIVYYLVVPIPESLGYRHTMVVASIVLGIVTYRSADVLWVGRYAREVAGLQES